MSTEDRNNVNPEASEVEEFTAEQLSEQRQIRREKLKKLQAMGRNPFLHEKWDIDAYSEDVKTKFEEMDGKTVSMAGRIMANRHMGKASFVDIQDCKGRIQLHIKKDVLTAEEYKIFLTYDIGDIVGVEGKVFKTQRGEVSVEVSNLVLLCKALQVLPNKWSGLKDQDQRYRQRYVDLIMNPEVRDTFRKRTSIIHKIKDVLENTFGYLEVDTPILTVIAGGGNARPFETHHNTLDLDMKMRIANELYLKRLVVGGLDRVYEMGKMFRNEGMDRNHNPEFTSMECYAAYTDEEFVMQVTEEVVSQAALATNGSMIINYQGKTFDLTPPWRRLDMTEAVADITGVDFRKIDEDQACRDAALAYMKDHPSSLTAEEVNTWTRGKIIAEFFEEYCEDVPGFLDGPIFVCGHPVEISPLAKRDSADPRITRRFEAYVNCWEIANGFSELNDAIDQFERFSEQQRQLDLGLDDEAHPMDMDFVNALEVGLPPTGGLGIGIDRVIMLITDAPSIRDIILFPTMKPLDSERQKKVETKERKLDLSKVKVEPLFEEDIDFETFSKSDFRAVKIMDCEAVPKSKKLLKFTLNDGSGKERTILSGIHSFYEPEELVGKTAVAITNLPPRNMMGIESCGMLCSMVYDYDGEEDLQFILLDDSIPAGAKLY